MARRAIPAILQVEVTYSSQFTKGWWSGHRLRGRQADRDTVVNLTNHAYFNLAGRGARIHSSSMSLQLCARTSLLPSTAEVHYPPGRSLKWRERPWTFQKLWLRLLSSHRRRCMSKFGPARGYDHNWIINAAGGRGLVKAARVEHGPSTGTRPGGLDHQTWYPILQWQLPEVRDFVSLSGRDCA
jgi:aldose 1-epimerase